MRKRGKGDEEGGTERREENTQKNPKKVKKEEESHRSYVAPFASARLSSCSNDPNSSSWIEQHAQPLASSIVSARSAVVLFFFPFPPSFSSPSFPLFLFLCRDRSLRTSLASMLTSATSLTTQPILRWLEFWSRWRRTVVLPKKESWLRVEVFRPRERGEKRRERACAPSALWFPLSLSLEEDLFLHLSPRTHLPRGSRSTS